MRQRINTYYAGNNGKFGLLDFTGRFTAGPNALAGAGGGAGAGEADFFLGLPDRVRPRRQQRNMGPAGQHPCRLRAGRLQDLTTAHVEPRAAMGDAYAVGGSERPANEFRADQRSDPGGRLVELYLQQLPRVVQQLQRNPELPTSPRVCVQSERVRTKVRGARRLHPVLLPGRHWHEPPPAVEPSAE